jgi:hypothetical protein
MIISYHVEVTTGNTTNGPFHCNSFRWYYAFGYGKQNFPYTDFSPFPHGATKAGPQPLRSSAILPR